MAATPEAKVKAAVRRLLDKHGAYYAMPIGSGYGNAGVPDFLCCVPTPQGVGVFLAIEAKAGINKPTALQERHLDKIAQAGGVSMVVNEEGLAGLDAVLTHLKTKEHS